MATEPTDQGGNVTGIENTAVTHEGDRLLSQATSIPVGYLVPPGSIEAQEAEGQRALVASSVLPSEIMDPLSEFEALGFVFGERVEGDPIFVNVTLPEGWRKEGSDHDMWSYVVDETGKRRVAVFYKAAFYDRRAFMRLEHE